MNCFKEEQIFDYINKELEVSELLLIENHLQDCSICKSIYEQKINEINFIKHGIGDIDELEIEIPEFIFPEDKQTKRTIRITPLFIKLGIAATILILVTFSILFLNNNDNQDIDLQRLQIQQEMAITDMNEAWHDRELIITQIDENTGNAQVYLSSEFED